MKWRDKRRDTKPCGKAQGTEGCDDIATYRTGKQRGRNGRGRTRRGRNGRGRELRVAMTSQHTEQGNRGARTEGAETGGAGPEGARPGGAGTGGEGPEGAGPGGGLPLLVLPLRESLEGQVRFTCPIGVYRYAGDAGIVGIVGTVRAGATEERAREPGDVIPLYGDIELTLSYFAI